jgi:hypothetical protein
MPIATRWLGEQFEEGGAFHDRELVAVRELIGYARSAMDAPPKVSDTVREKNVVAALRRAGYKRIERKLRFNDGATGFLWTSKAPGLFMQQEPRFILHRYSQEFAAADSQKKGA